ncbi:hypothetical protein [Chryseobacterium turcicum]|uniref:HEAT repeat domain-containing protein n=1 Tax=Chryseobacterium turcicum TaxID=2898076 RepID=A0A9Q3V2J9_9FLAO|nr:hypothetical protein [Chryseobacterium turcicum]MCD1116573.1 hypothetical protein [Chryseobacterium turcicum]
MNESEVTKLFEEAYKAKTDNNYWNQIFELRKFVTAEMISKCFELIDSDDLKSKEIGIDVLSQLGQDRKGFATQMLDKIFEIFETSSDEKLISKSLFAVGHNNKYIKNKHFSVLEKFKISNSTDIRYALTFSLLGIKRKAAIKILIKLAQDKSLRIRDWATFGLGTQIETDTKEIRDILYKNSLSKNDQIRQEAIKGLANRNDERVEELILSELHKENFGTLFFDTLLNIKNGEQYLPFIINIYEKYKNDQDINTEWLSDLKNCIKVLQEV